VVKETTVTKRVEINNCVANLRASTILAKILIPVVLTDLRQFSQVRPPTILARIQMLAMFTYLRATFFASIFYTCRSYRNQSHAF
jgi:hypothetical protein